MSTANQVLADAAVDPLHLHRLRKSPMQRALTVAVLEAMVVAGLSVVLEAWIVPLLQKRLDASALMIGALTIAPMLAAGLIGPVVAPIISFLGGNKRTGQIACLVQIVSLALMSIPLWFTDQPWARPLALSLAITVLAVGTIAGPAWTAWMGGLIPRRIRGRYHTGRMRIWTLMRIIFAIVFVLIMEQWNATDSSIGLQIVLAIGVISRIASWWLLSHLPEELPKKIRINTYSTGKILRQESRDFGTFLRSMPRTDLGKWTMVWALLHAGTMLAGPYFCYYWLLATSDGGLGLDLHPRLYTMLLYTSTVTRLLAFPVCGRLVDRYGPAAILRIAVAGICVIPIGHALSTDMPILFITEVFSGLFWCLAESAVGVLLFSCSSDPLHRARLIGYHQSVCCIVIVIAVWAGGYLIPILPELDGSRYRMLFLISMVLRIPAVILAIRVLPALKNQEEMRGMWRHVPGLASTITLSRGIVRAFKE